VVYNASLLKTNIMNIPEFDEIIEPNDQTEARKEHLEKLRELVGNVYPNKFERSRLTGAEDTITRVVAFAAPIKERHIPPLAENERPSDDRREAANAELNSLRVRVAGRLAVPPRVMGKAAFVHLSDGVSRLQIYCRKEDFTVLKNTNSSDSQLSTLDSWTAFGWLDHGDFIGVEGYLFVTKTGELSVHVETIRFLSKAMLPMPDKMHGIEDAEIKQRQRYADLIASSLKIDHEENELTTRQVFEIRSKVIREMRRFLDDAGYIEVETPMLTPKATGAAARPFETFHEALKIPLYARIAPELYLKRLVVGGFEKVYELNRNFRNEGISTRHNPEFTMLEFYCAYMDVNGMMDFCEQMIKESVRKATGGRLQVKYGESEIDFSKFEQLGMSDAIIKELQNKSDYIDEIVDANFLEETTNLLTVRKFTDFFKDITNRQHLPSIANSNVEFEAQINQSWLNAAEYVKNNPIEENLNQVQIFVEIFEELVEENLIQPTFIIDYPKSISPLSKASPDNPNIAERFELFINGMECANGFSELNDPQEQYERFKDQMNEREKGDDEAMILDEDYIRALSYGMPPAAGIGIGIDRIVMLLTNRQSIRDVILFPHLRPERKDAEKIQ
jgi:lysyl-tRNA synthetase class 2